ncbi:MAG: pyridoxal-phosphate dependent enzyme [Colwellia sp.]|nr:pyridoxal-phosphate dependent enzyme [Colwellia sp.]
MSLPSPLQTIKHSLFDRHKITVMIKRDDLIHPIISGNKWRKLKYNIEHAKKHGKKGIISFGGAYSNHIHALAFACYQEKLPCLGIIRGESHYANNFTLSWARHWQMKLSFVDRKTYRLRADRNYLNELQAQYPQHLIVPEGGSNSLAILGVTEIIDELNQQAVFDTLLTPVGSGGTLAGLISGDKNQHEIIGIAVLKQGKQSEQEKIDSQENDYLAKEVSSLLPFEATRYNNWQILSNHHLGGYAKFSDEDSQRILTFNQETGINFEPVYSGKMLLALLDLVEQGYFPQKHRIVMLHTGGLQGLGGLHERSIIKNNGWSLPDTAPQS